MRLAALLFLLVSSPALAAESRKIAIDVPAGSEEIADSLRDSGWLRWLRSRSEGLEVAVEPGAEGDIEVLVRPLPVGAAVEELLGRLPVRLSAGILELDGTAYRDQSLALAVRLPEREKRTWVVTGYRADRLTDLAGLLLLTESGQRVWHRRGQPPFDYLLRETSWLERSGLWRASLRGGTKDTEATGFGVDRDAERDDFQARDAYYGGMRTIPGQSVELRASPEIAGRREVKELARRLDTAAAEMARRIPLVLEKPIELVVERDHVAQGRYLDDIGEAVLTLRGAVHVVFHPDDEHAYLHRVAGALLARAGLAESLTPWIEEGAALWLSRQWFGREYEAWLPRLAAARLLPSAEQLLAAEKQGDGSAPLWVPPAASLVDAVPGATLRKKLAALPGKAAARAHLTRLADLSPPDEQRSSQDALPFLRGVSFAMLNRLDGGYHAPSVDERLERLGQIGADAVSLMPFAYQRKPDDSRLRFQNRSPTSETDIGVLYAARQARAAGFRVLWKPHIWVSHDSWPGEIEMKDEAGWAAWWESYRRYVAHHAFLAEWAGSELFSIGVELGKTLERRREWEELIASVRLLFSGAVTYAGNWHSDYDRAHFWDRLDFIGVDAYFPLASGEDVLSATVSAGAREVTDRLRQAAERFGKPVLLTEIGYAARTGAWVEPHREGGTFSAEHQALAYRALLQALGRPSWLGGVFAWKAFSADRGDDTRADFRFLGRPAEAVLRDYFIPPSPAGLHTSN